MTGTCDVGQPINIIEMAETYFRYCEYEPEINPCLVFSVVKPKVREASPFVRKRRNLKELADLLKQTVQLAAAR